jgi:tetratricopeptide (TPR) repeat protein
MTSSTTADKTGWTENENFVHSTTLTLVDDLIREAKPDEARRLLLDLMREAAGDKLLAAVYYLAEAECAAGNLYEALRLFTEHYPIADHSTDDYLVAKYNFGYATTCQTIFHRENLESFADRALEAYAGASYFYAKAGATDVAASTKNNEALLLAEFGRIAEARKLLGEARGLFKGRAVKLAQVDMSEVELCFKEGGKEVEAYQLAARAVAVFMEHEEVRLIVEATPLLQKASADFMAVNQSQCR